MNYLLLLATWLGLFALGMIAGYNGKQPSPVDPSSHVFVLLFEAEDKEYIPLSVHNTLIECVEESFRIKEEGDFFMCEKLDLEETL